MTKTALLKLKARECKLKTFGGNNWKEGKDEIVKKYKRMGCQLEKDNDGHM